MRIYLSGPISGYKNGNRDIFGMFKRAIEGQGHQVISPHDIEPLYIKGRGDWERHMAADIQALVMSDLVFVISDKKKPGSGLGDTYSRGAGYPNPVYVISNQLSRPD